MNVNLNVNLKANTIENEIGNLTFQVSEADSNVRLDSFLAQKIEDWSRSRLQKLIDDRDVLVNGKASKSSYRLCERDEIEIELVAPQSPRFEPEDISLDIIFEDDDIAVINKPAGMVVHPGAGVSGGTLANAIAFHFQIENQQSESENNRTGIVHRLDKDTSGLIVIAKNETAHGNLNEQFRNREVFKSYLALVHGVTKEERGTIDQPLARDRTNRLRMAITKTGRNAVTLWRLKERFVRFTLLEMQIKTGRTHQIRVHLASIKHPVVGDEIYNGGRDKTVMDVKVRSAISKLNRFFLHAEKIGFKHPRTGEYLKFHVPLPPELESFLALLRTGS
ncbi:MAG: RluA family pseudouridine synthase [Pyrinomonadaceae bacterium]